MENNENENEIKKKLPENLIKIIDKLQEKLKKENIEIIIKKVENAPCDQKPEI